MRVTLAIRGRRLVRKRYENSDRDRLKKTGEKEARE